LYQNDIIKRNIGIATPFMCNIDRVIVYRIYWKVIYVKTRQLKELYERTLLEDIIPFWMKYSLDNINGGYYHYVDRDGSILSTDKSVWIQGRQTWMFSKLYNTFEKRQEWLEIAASGYNFLKDYCFDSDGRMFFQVTCDGKPLRKRRYWFSEAFAAIAFAEYAKAAGNDEILLKSKEIYNLMVKLYRNPDVKNSKVIAETRKIKSHSETMILIATSQALRDVQYDGLYNEIIDECMDELLTCFVDRDKKALFEFTGPNGEKLDTPQGRCLNPGHAIETSCFLMNEGLYRNDLQITKMAMEILDWMLERGWDKKYGGLFYFQDVDGKPPEQLEWDMKLWWPHNEAMYALLLACYISEDKKYEQWYEKVHRWSFEHFPDPEYGEWYGYLHRDGSVLLPIKGSMWKGPFHLPRYLLNSIKLMEKM